MMAAYNKKAHLRANIEAIKIAFTLGREKRTATPEEVTTLKGYTGFGGLKCILSPANNADDVTKWSKSEQELFPMVQELHGIIRDNTTSDIQYRQYVQSLKNSVLTAFYTPSEVVQAIAESLKEAGVFPTRTLDPSAGIGEFVTAFNNISIAEKTIFSYEKDILTGQMLSALHPETTAPAASKSLEHKEVLTDMEILYKNMDQLNTITGNLTSQWRNATGDSKHELEQQLNKAIKAANEAEQEWFNKYDQIDQKLKHGDSETMLNFSHPESQKINTTGETNSPNMVSEELKNEFNLII